jgi:hypothetical protein
MLRITLAMTAAVLLLSASWNSAQEPRKATGAEAEAAAAKWLEGLKKTGLVLNEKPAKHGFAVSFGQSAFGNVTKFNYELPGWAFHLTFRGDMKADTPLKELKEHLWHAVIDKVPTPGLAVPGWDIKPQTPVSSFEQGIEIHSYGEGKIKVRVLTNFFALYGRDPSVLVPADAPSPPGSYFQLRKDFPLDLTIEAPVEFPK